jgi:hypothetical protein
LLFFL